MLVNSQNEKYDVVIIGGGINGTAIAADAAGRGLKVLLAEQSDLASGTSSASSKLIHGGLRYLEQYAFQMVRHSLKEREILCQNAPHLVHPIQFILPIHPRLRSSWLIRLGLYFYDLLGGRSQLARSRVVELENNADINPLNLTLKKGFSYSDCTVNDARLVILNAIRAAQFQCRISTRTKVIGAKYSDKDWSITLEDQLSHQKQTVSTTVLINAAGPWLDKVIQGYLHTPSQYKLKLVKGSHIVLPKLYDGNQGYLLQLKDRRVIFVIPYHGQFTMIGTTDVPFQDSLDNIKISQSEIDYLINALNEYFHHSIKSNQIVTSWSGVRALVDTKSQTLAGVSREYKLELIHTPKIAPLVNVFGGKLTTHRYLAEEVMTLIKPFFKKMLPSWTAHANLPGGDLGGTLDEFSLKLQTDFPFLEKGLCERFANYYGTLCYQFLKGKDSLEAMGHHFGHQLYEVEIKYLIDHEWAVTAEDILERRTKLGLILSESERLELESWLIKHQASA